MDSFVFDLDKMSIAADHAGNVRVIAAANKKKHDSILQDRWDEYLFIWYMYYICMMSLANIILTTTCILSYHILHVFITQPFKRYCC